MHLLRLPGVPVPVCKAGSCLGPIHVHTKTGREPEMRLDTSCLAVHKFLNVREYEHLYLVVVAVDLGGGGDLLWLDCKIQCFKNKHLKRASAVRLFSGYRQAHTYTRERDILCNKRTD